MKSFRLVLSGLAVSALIAAPLLPIQAVAADEGAGTTTLKGEIVDLMCYLDHGAKGEQHQKCAEKCIKAGGPVGLLSGEDLYLVVGDHEPANDKLASKAGQEVTLKGKVATRNGMKMLQNAELQ